MGLWPVPEPLPHRHVPLWPLALITLSGTSAMHMFVPALPVAAQDLATSPALVQLTISVYILALGLGQLVFGPLSDSFGRRPLLLAGLVLFTLGGLASALAPNVHVLLVARFAQALGGCVGMLLPRAIVRDTSGVDEAVRRLLPVTGSPTGRISMASVLGDYRSLLGTRRFVGLAIGGACSTTSTFAFITAAPFIFVQQLQRPLPEVGVYLGLMIIGAFIGNALASQLAGRLDKDRLMVGAHLICLGSALAFVVSLMVWGPKLGVILVLVFLHALGAGLCSPVASVQAVSVVPRLIGSASGLYGCMQMLVGASCAALVTLHPDAALAAACVMLAFSLLGQAGFWLARQGADAHHQR